MSLMLTLAFLFFIGAVSGWILELIYRRFSPDNASKKWINPGLCKGPYLPIYGCGLCALFLLSSIEGLGFCSSSKCLLFTVMALSMTAIEYVAGLLCLHVFHVRLWDYSNEWGNIKGIICPKYSFFWAILSAIYFWGIHPYILASLDWFSHNPTFSFIVGLFFGIFIVDLINSTQLLAKLKQYANKHQITISFDALKSRPLTSPEKGKKLRRFFFPFYNEKTLYKALKDLKNSFEDRK